MKALIVDDVPLMRKVIASKLEKLGVDKVIETGDPKKAIGDFNAESGIKLIIADYRMPSMNGGDFFHKIYKMDKSKEVITVLMSGIEDLAFIKNSDGLDINHYLSKTDLIEQLETIVEEARNYIPQDQSDLIISNKELEDLLRDGAKNIRVEQNLLVIEFADKSVLLDLPDEINITKTKGE